MEHGDTTEYKIIKGTIGYCQKKLNQWRRDYRIKVLSMCASTELGNVHDRIIILLVRRRKCNG